MLAYRSASLSLFRKLASCDRRTRHPAKSHASVTRGVGSRPTRRRASGAHFRRVAFRFRCPSPRHGPRHVRSTCVRSSPTYPPKHSPRLPPRRPPSPPLPIPVAPRNPRTPGILRVGAVGFRAGDRGGEGVLGVLRWVLGGGTGSTKLRRARCPAHVERRGIGDEHEYVRHVPGLGGDRRGILLHMQGHQRTTPRLRLYVYHRQCVETEPGTHFSGKKLHFHYPSSGETFFCDLHMCVNCRNSSDYQCLCCPFYSVCHDCLRRVEFVKLGNQNKGLCGYCFNLAISIEKNAADPREKILYDDSDSSEILFKDYWDLIKDRERLTLADLQIAGGHLDRGVNYKHEEDSEKFPDEDRKSDEDFLGDGDDKEQAFAFDSTSKPEKIKTSIKRKRSKKKTYVGWGTEELIGFLSCFGKDTKEPLDEAEVVGVVKEYIKQKDLFLRDKKKYFQCDDKLRPLFTRRKVKYNMLYSKLRMHLAANADSEDEYDDGSEDNNGPVMKKKLQTNLELNIAKKVSERNKRCFASLIQHNINLLYLRRSLVITFLSDLDTFQQKVVGCFVRVKTKDHSYIFHKVTEPLQLGLVTGIKNSKEKYKVKDKGKDISTDVFLCVVGFLDDVKISSLSDEDIGEDEYNGLIHLAEKGLLKRPTVGEFEEKVAAVHTDIVNNLLSTPAEQQRRLTEIPEIIADAEDEKETEARITAGNSCVVNRGKKRERASCLVDMDESSKGVAECAAEYFGVQKEKPPEGVTEQAVNAFNIPNEESSKGVADQIADSLRVHGEESTEGAAEKMADSYSLSLLNEEPSEVASKQGDATREVASEAGEALSSGLTPDSVLHSPVYKAQDGSKTEAIDISKDESNHSKRNKGGNIPVREVINLDTSDDDDEDLHAPERETVHPPGAMNGGDLDMERPESALHARGAMNGVHLGLREAAPATVNGMSRNTSLWHYLDPQGETQGPFKLIQLWEWRKGGFFDEGFKVWRSGQTKEHAIFLRDAFRVNL
ncbi:hypothetical protein EJB05_18202, partial [Eragrostis curvula]